LIETHREIELLERFFDRYNLDQDLSLDSANPLVIKHFINHPKLVYINDVTGLHNTDILKILAPTNLKLISMHSKGGIPPSLKSSEIPDDFYQEDGGFFEHMKKFWQNTLNLSKAYGISSDRLILDPGLGFGKNLAHSLELVNLVPRLKQEFALPIMIGSSRKSFLKLWKPQNSYNNQVLDELTQDYNSLFEGVFFRMHIPAKI
jgi:dihydropteroate synthase